MDPLTANLVILVPAAAITAAFAFVILWRRGDGGGTTGLSRAESWVVSIIGGLAILNALSCAIGLFSNAAWIFDVEPFRVSGLKYSGATAPERLAGVDHVAASGYESAWAEVMGLPDASRWLFYLEIALPLISVLAVSVVVAWLSFTLVRDRPFVRAFPIGIGITAIAVMVGGLGSQLAAAMARSSVVEYLGADALVADDTTTPATESFAWFSLQLDLAPVGAALALMLVAAAFQIGTRMQRDTEALV
ncbi:hypothetical protein G5T42_04060 [Microbacterium sp. 4R-513]|uniref:hypothetical protein n=1 Tax=Microbacterium sp. 4R-513 TaxID=2567934 RepID=UPI0013E16B80|nr:hypothetical protein [Microbacterium sp. 4R-513]QIG38764.1 hypothetical protein G5T42_04060 [Microbacterium sp. 4R-513]